GREWEPGRERGPRHDRLRQVCEGGVERMREEERPAQVSEAVRVVAVKQDARCGRRRRRSVVKPAPSHRTAASLPFQLEGDLNPLDPPGPSTVRRPRGFRGPPAKAATTAIATGDARAPNVHQVSGTAALS